MPKWNRVPLLLSLIVLSQSWSRAADAQDLKEFEKKVTEFTLDNGLKFIVVERHEAPVVSFLTYADVGSVDEVKGITGIAHIFEHLAFKGTQTVGTSDYRAEEDAMARIDDIFAQLKAEKNKGREADEEIVEELQEQFKRRRSRLGNTWYSTSSRKPSSGPAVSD